jgi:hypothetical protein
MAGIVPTQDDFRIARSVWTARALAPLSRRDPSLPVYLPFRVARVFRGSKSAFICVYPWLKRPLLQNEPNFKIKPIKPFFKNAPQFNP